MWEKMIRKKEKFSRFLALGTLSFALLLGGCGSTGSAGGGQTQAGAPEETTVVQLAVLNQDVGEDAPLQVHFLDVGQADCTLVVCEGEAMLIDGGDAEDAEIICDYLDEQGIEELKYAIGTHPHEDHIGSLDDVLYHLYVEQLILPPADYASRFAKDVEDAAEYYNVPIMMSEVGDVYTLGSAEFTILGPVNDYEDEWNNWSVSLRLVYGENSFIFTGDAEMEAEYDMLDTGLSMDAQVYQVGHHGSSTSSSEALMEAVNPEYAVISCELGNEYGHPHRETMQILEEYQVSVFRTDVQGTIVASCDGKNISWSTEPKIQGQNGTSSNGGGEEQEQTYALNTNTKKFHRMECENAGSIRPENYEEFHGTREELIGQGYKPCGGCEP